jgi:hypothetical protein
MPAMQRRVDNARNRYQQAVRAHVNNPARNDPNLTPAERTAAIAASQTAADTQYRGLMQVLGSTSGYHDVLSQTSPEAARAFAENLLQREYRSVGPNGEDGPAVPLFDVIEGSRNDPAFQQVHKELMAAAGDDRARRAAAEAAARAGLGGPQGGLPTL